MKILTTKTNADENEFLLKKATNGNIFCKYHMLIQKKILFFVFLSRSIASKKSLVSSKIKDYSNIVMNNYPIFRKKTRELQIKSFSRQMSETGGFQLMVRLCMQMTVQEYFKDRK
jgi:hypothetical protein